MEYLYIIIGAISIVAATFVCLYYFHMSSINQGKLEEDNKIKDDINSLNSKEKKIDSQARPMDIDSVVDRLPE